MLRRSILAGALTGAIFGLLASILIFATHSFLFGIGWDTAGYGILNILLFTAGGAVFGVAFAIVSQFVGRAIAALSLTVLFWGIGGFSVGSLPATLAFTGVFLAIAGLEGRRELGAIPLVSLLVAPPLVSFVSPAGFVAPYTSSLTEGVLENAALSLLPQGTPAVWSLPHHSWTVVVYVKDAQGNPIPEATVLPRTPAGVRCLRLLLRRDLQVHGQPGQGLLRNPRDPRHLRPLRLRQGLHLREQARRNQRTHQVHRGVGECRNA
jgi:hypothetical protein